MTRQVFLKTFYIYVIPYFVLLTVIFSLMYAFLQVLQRDG